METSFILPGQSYEHHCTSEYNMSPKVVLIYQMGCGVKGYEYAIDMILNHEKKFPSKPDVTK
jgi:hypothetical protein